jgi:hypothetical protein
MGLVAADRIGTPFSPVAAMAGPWRPANAQVLIIATAVHLQPRNFFT